MDEHPEKNGGPNPALSFKPVKSGGLTPSTEEERLARVRAWDKTREEMAQITDESDTEEIWDEILRNLGVDPATGGGLEP